jgi:hypothetical protein
VIAIADLPCWTCSKPQAVEVRHWLGQGGELDETRRMPTSGLPLTCCRVRSVPVPMSIVGSIVTS